MTRLDLRRAAALDVWQPMEVVHALPIWEELRRAAAEALSVFARRGALPEGHEV